MLITDKGMAVGSLRMARAFSDSPKMCIDNVRGANVDRVTPAIVTGDWRSVFYTHDLDLISFVWFFGDIVKQWNGIQTLLNMIRECRVFICVIQNLTKLSKNLDILFD